MNVIVLVPEVLVAAAALLTIVPGAAPGLRMGRTTLRILALVIVGAAFIAELVLGARLTQLFNGGFVQDRFALFAKLAVLAALLVGTAGLPLLGRGRLAATAAPLAALGAMVAASATNVVGLWAGITLAAVAGLATARDRVSYNPRLFTAVGLGISGLAFMSALVYGVAGDSRLAVIQEAMVSEPLSLPLAVVVIGALLAAASLVVLPLVELISGEPTNAPGSELAAALTVGAGVVVTLKLSTALGGVATEWTPFVAATAAVAVVAGGVASLAARSLRQLVGCLGITQLGWVLAAWLLPNRLGAAAALFLLAGYLLALAALPSLERVGVEGDGRLPRLAGTVALAPYRSVTLALVMLSLAGVPPLAGWFGQLAVGIELARSGYFWLLALALVGSALAAFACVRAIQILFLQPLPIEIARGRPLARVRLTSGDAVPLLAAALVIAYGLFANPIHSLAVQAGTALFVH
jgi:NADH-quinone oxidoreductase subunit N